MLSMTRLHYIRLERSRQGTFSASQPVPRLSVRKSIFSNPHTIYHPCSHSILSFNPYNANIRTLHRHIAKIAADSVCEREVSFADDLHLLQRFTISCDTQDVRGRCFDKRRSFFLSSFFVFVFCFFCMILLSILLPDFFASAALIYKSIKQYSVSHLLWYKGPVSIYIVSPSRIATHKSPRINKPEGVKTSLGKSRSPTNQLSAYAVSLVRSGFS